MKIFLNLLKRYLFIKFLFGLFILFGIVFPANAEQKSIETNICGFSPGQPLQKLKILGMPFPIDTAGCYTFINKRENVLFRFFSKKQNDTWVISSVMLVNMADFPYNTLLNDHQMLTGFSLSRFRTGRNLQLGATMEMVLKIYGVPDSKTKTDNGEDWLYNKCSFAGSKNSCGSLKAGVMIIGLRGNRVVSIKLSDSH
jgi:hypothetical protein